MSSTEREASKDLLLTHGLVDCIDLDEDGLNHFTWSNRRKGKEFRQGRLNDYTCLWRRVVDEAPSGKVLSHSRLSDHLPIEWTVNLSGGRGRSRDISFKLDNKYLKDPAF